MSFIKRYREDSIALKKIYLAGWLAPTVVFLILVYLPFWGNVSLESIVGVVFHPYSTAAILSVFVVYQVVMIAVLWRQTKISKISKKSQVVLSISPFLVIALVLLNIVPIWTSSGIELDNSEISSSKMKSIVPTVQFPFSGVWKSHCSDNFGILFEPTESEGYYYAIMCTENGCEKKESVSQILLENNPNYEIVDNNTIGMMGPTGKIMLQNCSADLGRDK